MSSHGHRQVQAAAARPKRKHPSVATASVASTERAPSRASSTSSQKKRQRCTCPQCTTTTSKGELVSAWTYRLHAAARRVAASATASVASVATSSPWPAVALPALAVAIAAPAAAASSPPAFVFTPPARFIFTQPPVDDDESGDEAQEVTAPVDAPPVDASLTIPNVDVDAAESLAAEPIAPPAALPVDASLTIPNVEVDAVDCAPPPAQRSLLMERAVWKVGETQSTQSVGEFVRSFMAASTKTNVTRAAMSTFYDLMRGALPPDNPLPPFSSLETNLLASCSVATKVYIMCPNDCAMASETPLGQLQARDATPAQKKELDDILNSVKKCTVCGSSFVDEKKRIVKVFHYLGLETHLRMMMEDKDLSRHMHLPHPGIGALPRVDVPDPPPPIVEPHLDSPCRNLWESVGWFEGVVKDAKMSQGTNNIALALNVDGVQPFDRGGVTLHPFLLQVLNLPENLRIRGEYIILAGVIPGKHAPKHFNTYLAPLVDELILLYERGFMYTDPYARLPRRAYVKLLFTACDYPGHGSVNYTQHQGATYGCQKCDLTGVKQGSRAMAYSNFDDLYRDGAVPPTPLTHAEYMARAQRHQRLDEQRRAGQLNDTQHRRAKIEQCRQVKGRSQLARLPYFDMVDHTLLDLMHTIQGILGAHIVPLMKGQRLKGYLQPSTSAAPKKPAKRASKVKPARAASRKKPSAAAPAAASAASAAIVGSDVDDDGDSIVGVDVNDAPAPASIVEHDVAVDPCEALDLDAIDVNDEIETVAATVDEVTESDDDGDDEYREDASDDDRGDAVRLIKPTAKKRRKEMSAAAAAALLPDIPPAAPARTVKQKKQAAKDAASKRQQRLAHETRVRLAKFQQMYHASKDGIALMERGYDRIQAPGKIAPATKKPFTCSGHMTADTWLTFARVYGKYLFKLHFTRPDQQPQLIALCNLLDLMSTCARLSQTIESKARIAELVKRVAQHFEEDFPETEHAIVVHNLLFHIPATINRWGPAVGFWCFPYERMLGKLCRLIKSKKHPVATLVKRYRLSIATASLQPSTLTNDVDVDDEAEDDQHALFNAAALNSFADPSFIHWPKKTRGNSKTDPRTLRQHHARERILEPLLGRAVTSAYAGQSTAFELTALHTRIQVGRHKFSCRLREDSQQIRRTRESWFSILAKHVPEYARANPDRDGDEVLYGRIYRFLQLDLEAWRPGQPFLLAEASLFQGYEETSEEPCARLPFIQTNDALGTARRDDRTLPFWCFQVQHIRSAVAIAPHATHRHRMYVLEL